MKTLLIAILFSSLIENHAEDTIRVAFYPRQSAFLEGEPIILKMVITNMTDHVQVIDLGVNRETAMLFGTNSLDMQTNAMPLRYGLVAHPKVTIEPKKTYVQNIFLDQWFSLVVGEHVVYGSVQGVSSTTCSVRIKVISCEPVMLQRRLSELVHVAQKRIGVYDGDDPAYRGLRAIYRRSDKTKTILRNSEEVEPGLKWLMEHDPYD
jgi:hypothetical protein